MKIYKKWEFYLNKLTSDRGLWKYNDEENKDEINNESLFKIQKYYDQFLRKFFIKRNKKRMKLKYHGSILYQEKIRLEIDYYENQAENFRG